jgi:hypothetical protein
MPNPYLSQQAGAITQQANQNLQQNVLPGIGSGAVAAGGYGGSRQGVAEGIASGMNQQGITNSLANLYGTNYQQDQQNDISRQSVNNQYNLGLGNLGLNAQGQNNNFYTQQRSLDQNGAALGANLYNQGTQGNLSQGSGLYNLGTQQQQAPWLASNNAGNVFSQFSGLGGGQTQTQNGSPLGGALGGAIAAGQFVGNLGLGTTQPYQSPYALTGVSQGSQNYGNLENNVYGG